MVEVKETALLGRRECFEALRPPSEVSLEGGYAGGFE